jgi:hypothetical protein
MHIKVCIALLFHQKKKKINRTHKFLSAYQIAQIVCPCLRNVSKRENPEVSITHAGQCQLCIAHHGLHLTFNYHQHGVSNCKTKLNHNMHKNAHFGDLKEEYIICIRKFFMEFPSA